MKNEALRNLRLAKKTVSDIISQIESGKDWRYTHKNIIHSIKLIKSAMRKYIFFNMLKKKQTDEFLNLYRHLD